MATNGKSRWLKWTVSFLLILAAGIGGLWYANQKPEEGPQFVTGTVSKGDVTQAVTATGTLNPVLNVQVGSQISGIIQKLYVDFNSKVKAGDVVAQLDAASYQNRVEQNDADLASARATLELAQINARRAQELFKNSLISQAEHDTTMAGLRQAEASVKQREAVLASSRVDLSRCTISSPVDGIVIDRKVDVGQTVAASMNAPTLFLIANDLTKMQINANISEADIGGIVEGQSVNFTVDAFPGRTFAGKVFQVRNSPTTVQNVVSYDTIIEVSNPDLKLKPGMTANVSVITAQKKGVLKISNAALRFKPPEPSTNLTFSGKILASIGLGKKKPAVDKPATNAVAKAAVADTNATPAEVVLTGNEPAEELFKKMREIREAGGEVPEAARTRMRERMAAGELRPPGGGGGGGGGGGFGGGGGGGGRSGGGARASASSGPVSRTVYVLVTNTPPGGGVPVTEPKALRIKSGITDGTSTEIVDGLKEGDTVIMSVKLPQSSTTAAAAAPQGTSPFGGGFGRGPR